MVTSRSASCASSCSTNFSTTILMISGDRCAKVMIASSRLRNSGANRQMIASMSSPSRLVRVKPNAARAISEAPALVVMIRITWRKSMLAAVVGQLAVIHDLQEHIEHVRMRLLDFVKEQHAVRMLVDAVGEQPALVEADIAGRRADQPRHGVALHIFRHVEADQLNAERC